MAKCGRCGKNKLFQKMNENGVCVDCDRIQKLEKEESELQIAIGKLQTELEKTKGEYSDIKLNKDKLYNEIKEKAKNDAMIEIADKIELRNIELKKVIDSIEIEKDKLKLAILEYEQSQKLISLNANKLRKLQTTIKSIQYSLKKFAEEESYSVGSIDNTLVNEAEELLSTTIKIKLHLMDVRELRKLYNQNSKVIKELLERYQSRYTTKANMSIYRLMVIALEAELQNVLYNLCYSKLDKAINDIKTIAVKYEKIACDGNQNIAPTMKKFIGEIEYLYIEAIKIEYEYYIQKERIKEEQKTLRDQMRQEAAERKMLEEERKKVEQEEAKYENEISNIQEQLNTTTDELRIKQLEERILKIQSQLDEVEKKKEGIINLQNGKAGYIYIISNLGSFGDSMFKIGMTRRVNPQDRVDEIGDASVPFKFDVHSFIFSNSAPDLENSLHKNLNEKRVNKVNLRKEFFKTTIDELEDLVYSLEPSAEFNRTMMAEQYYQSMAVEEVPDSVNVIDDEDEDEEIEEV
jgi:hypothetical protein